MAGLISDAPAGGQVEVGEVGAVFGEALCTLVSDLDTLGENQLLHIWAVTTKFSNVWGREENGGSEEEGEEGEEGEEMREERRAH